MKVAIVHDWLTNMGGAEKVVIALHELFPDAPIYTSVANLKKLDPLFSKMNIKTTFIQKLPFSKSKYNRYLPLFPVAFESLDLRGYDVIITSSSSIGAKGILRDSTSIHICYCHTPPRYAWDFYQEYLYSVGSFQRLFIRPLMHYLRMYDQLSANRVDFFIANSSNVAERIKKIYQKNSKIIYPPVETAKFSVSHKSEDFYLVVSRLVQYKRIDIAIRACNELNKKLVIIGKGEEMESLKQIAGPNIQFLGYQPDSVVKDYMERCKAFLFPGYEDFGITPVEAQACGKPTIAYGKGGALDYVINMETGILFDEQSVDSMISAIRKLENHCFDPMLISRHVQKYDKMVFGSKLSSFIYESIQSHSL